MTVKGLESCDRMNEGYNVVHYENGSFLETWQGSLPQMPSALQCMLQVEQLQSFLGGRKPTL